MREVTATLAGAALAVVLAGCAAAPPSDPSLAPEALPTAAASAPSDVMVTAPTVEPVPTVSGDPDSATPLSSIRRGPVRARIEAVRESDGASLGVRVNTHGASEDDPLVSADCNQTRATEGFTIVVQDLAVEEGIDTATLGVAHGVDAPGAYDGVVTFLDSDGNAIRGTGTVVVAEGLEAGTFDVADPDSGDHLVGAWECRVF